VFAVICVNKLSAGATITTGFYNLAIGMGAMYSATSNVGNNVALGYSSLGQCTGSFNCWYW